MQEHLHERTKKPIMDSKTEISYEGFTKQTTTTEQGYHSTPNPAVQITNVINFQKYRHYGENRPGIKNQSKQFMTLQLSNLQGKLVRVIILCADADNEDMVHIHPNGLAGKYCHDGIYDKYYTINSAEEVYKMAIPYIHVERMKTRKNCTDKVTQHLMARASLLPSPWKERFMSQCVSLTPTKVDTTRVRLAVFVTVESSPGRLDKPLVAVSDVIKNGCQNTSLDILRVTTASVPARTGGCIYIFTTENSPPIEPGKYKVYITHDPTGQNQKLEHWMSEEFWPSEKCIFYKKVILYLVPSFEPDLNPAAAVQAMLHLVCPESNLSCTFPFLYVPEGDVMEVALQNDCGMFTATDLDERPSIKKSRLELFENDDITVTLNGSVKMKSRGHKGGGTSHVIRGNGSITELQGKSHITELHKQKSHLQTIDTENYEQMDKKIDNLFPFSSTKSDVISSNLPASVVDAHNQLSSLQCSHKKTGSILALRGKCRADSRSLMASPYQYAVFEHQNTFSSSLNKTVSHYANCKQSALNYPEPDLPQMSFQDCINISDRQQTQAFSSIKAAEGDAKHELWSDQNYSNGEMKHSFFGYKQNALEPSLQRQFSSLGQFVEGFQVNHTSNEASISVTDCISAMTEGNIDAINTTNLDSMDLAEFLADNLPTIDIHEISKFMNDSYIES